MAAYNLGCFAGSIPTIWIGNWLGRRKTIFLGSAIMVVGALLQCTSYSLGQLIVGRIVTGFGVYLCVRKNRNNTDDVRKRNEHGYRTNLAIRMLQVQSPRSNGYD